MKLVNEAADDAGGVFDEVVTHMCTVSCVWRRIVKTNRKLNKVSLLIVVRHSYDYLFLFHYLESNV